MGQLFDELKRRNVIRVAIAYLVASWLVLQVADLVLESFGAPNWVMQAFLLVALLGFVVVIVFAWAYELTPEGLKKEKEVDRSRSVTQQTGRKLNQITIAMLVAVVAFVVAERAIFDAPSGTEVLPEIATTAVADKSIAVLAFEDLSAEGDQEYFADGLSEELLNVLAQIPDLQVAGRTSSFAFKGQNKDLREIGDVLNVAHILEGSVRKSGNRIRVTAQLINADDGFHLFSESYDRDLTDVFEVQDEIAAKISRALQSRLIGSGAVQEATPTQIESFDLYLAARQEIHTRNADRMLDASKLLDRALEIDPDYPPALAQKALVTFLLSDNVGSYGTIPVAEALAVARPMIDRAIALDPGLAEAHAISGLLMGSEEEVPIETEVETLRHAVALNPSLVNAKTWLSTSLNQIGEVDEGFALLESIVERDPAFAPAFQNLVQGYIWRRQIDKANALVGRVERITGETSSVYRSWGSIALSEGNVAVAVRHFRRAYETNPSNTVLRFFYGIALQNIGEFEQMLSIALPTLNIYAHQMLGNTEAAENLLRELQPVVDSETALGITVFYFLEIGDYQAIIDYVEREFGGVRGVLEKFPRSSDNNTDYMGPLAFALQQSGRDVEFHQVTEAMKLAIDSIRAYGANSYPIWNSEAEYAALTGTDEELLNKLQHMVDGGLVTSTGLKYPMFERVAATDRYLKMDAFLKRRADEERAKLGLEPYRPMAATN